MSSAAKKTDRRPPAATDAGAHRRHVAGDDLRETMSGLPLAGVYGPSDLGRRLDATTTSSATRGASRSRAGRTRRCTAASCGRCACSPASARRRTPTGASSSCSTHGQTGLSTAFDMPTLMGYDPDHPRSLGEVGREGVAVASVDDMARPVRRHPARRGDDVDDDQRAGGRAARVLRRGRREPGRRRRPGWRGTIQNDMLKEFIAQKEWICGDPRRTCASSATCWCTARARMPLWNTISISGYHIREAGATAVQELAFTLADGIGYVAARASRPGWTSTRSRRGCRSSGTCTTTSSRRSPSSAPARRMWARIMRDRFGARTRARGCCARTRRPRACR